MKHIRPLLAAAAAVGIVAASTSCTVTDLVMADCLDNTPVVTVSGTFDGIAATPQAADLERFREAYGTNGAPYADGTTVDMRLADYQSQVIHGASDILPYPIMFDAPVSPTGLCLVGGSVVTTADPLTTDQADWHGATALVARHPQFTTVGFDVDNMGDGIAFTENAADFRVVGARLVNIHDDCVEDDGMRGGLIEDSYLECWAGVSARGYSGYVRHHGDETLTITDTMIWAKPTPQVNPGHIGWFKFSNAPTTEGTPPKLVLNNVILRADSAPNAGHSLDLPPTYRETPGGPRIPWPMECTNVVIVWTGGPPETYPYAKPPCAVVTGDVSVWDDAKAAWDEARP